MNDRDIKVLTDREHVLARPAMYISSPDPIEHLDWILTDEGDLKQQKLTYPDALLVIIKEVLDNSLDEGLKTDWKYSNKISVKIAENKVIIEDNGRGIPVKKANNDEWMPVTAVTHLKAGSNFNDERKSIGTNGIGVSATNIFSKKFELITCDGKKKIKVNCADNMSSTKHQMLLAGEQGTKVSFIPDYERFSLKEMPEAISLLLKTRLRILSWFYPKCDFRFNGEKMAVKAKDFASMFPSPSILLNTDKVYILAYPTEEPEFLTYVNGMSLRRGGSHLDYVSSVIVGDLREKLSKKYKNIKPADIRNRLGLVVFFKDFPNCQFDSQTKEALMNADKDVKAYLAEAEIDISDKISRRILNNKEFLENITDLYRAKEELAEKKELAKLNKKTKTVSSEKYFPPIGKSPKKYLMLTEGYSAFAGISKILGRDGIAYYSLRGKIMNVLDLSPSKFMQNQEISDLVNILGIDLSDPESDIAFEKVIILSDADMDGIAIASLAIALFSKIAPKALKEGRICRLNTPLLIGKKGSRVEDYWFEFPKQNQLKKGLKYFYLKGLGSWNKDDLDQVLKAEGGMDNLLLHYQADKKAKENIYNWFGKDTGARKDSLRGKEFHIDLM